MRNLLYTIEGLDVIKGIDTGRETSVEAEDLVIDEGGEGEVIEQISKVFPNVCISIFSETFVVETVDLGDLARFVISAKNGNSLRVSNFEGDEQSNGFNRIVPSVNIITCDIWLARE